LGRRRRFLDPVLILLAIAVRVAAILVLRSYDVPRSTYEHGEIAANLLAGRGFSMRFLGADGPTSQQAPAYPLVVALAYLVGGTGTPRALLLLELGQAVLGGLLVWGVLRLGRQLAPGPVSSWFPGVAGLVVALHPTLVYAATHVQVAALGTTLFVWAIGAGYQAGSSGRPRDAVFTGGWLALLALTDPILSMAMIGVAGAIWLGRARGSCPRTSPLRLVGLTLIIALAGIAPWLVRNVWVHGEFVAIKSTFGYAFWQGNCTLSEGTDKVRRASVDRVLRSADTTRSLSELNRALWKARHEAGYLDDIALSRSDYALLGSVPEPKRSRILFWRAVNELRADPGRYPRLCLRRLRYFVIFDETNPKSRVRVYRLAHVGLSLFALAGFLMAGPAMRRRLVPTVATVVAIALFHALTIVSARFHIPVEPLLAIWGAAGFTRWGKSRETGSGAASHHIERVRIIGRFGVADHLAGIRSNA
jgi:hypothetical protein